MMRFKFSCLMAFAAFAANAQTVVYQYPQQVVTPQPVVVQQPMVVQPQPVVVQPQPVVVQRNVLPNGTVMPVGAKVCAKCGGTGVRESFWKKKKCKHCKGYGYIMPPPPPKPVVVAPPHPKHHKVHKKH